MVKKRFSKFTHEQIVEFFRRSYLAADGLWFLKTEERLGFDGALEIDNEVWKILPKIQVRLIKEMMGLDKGVEALVECYTAKLALHGFQFKTEKRGNEFRIAVGRCPWHEIMVNSKRGHLSTRIGNLICRTETAVWAGEFGDSIVSRIDPGLCEGSKTCVISFSEKFPLPSVGEE